MAYRKIRIGINGFGRIGRSVARLNALSKRFDLVHINDVNSHVENMAYLFKYDSIYGKFPGEVTNDKEAITIDGHTASYSSFRSISEVDWKRHGTDIVIDASGVSENVIDARELIESHKVEKVIVTHSSEFVDREVILGINDYDLCPSDNIVSNSICDANAIAHAMKWLDEAFGVEGGSVTTLHPWLSYQNLVDGPAISQSNPGVVWKDFALGRASIGSLIPKDTTAMKATEKVLPQLRGKVMSMSYRIPTAVVASSDIVLKAKSSPTTKDVVALLEEKAQSSPYVRLNRESLVSCDYEREEASCIIDLQWVKAQNGLIKLILWYDNEWGYSARVLDLAKKLSSLPTKENLSTESRELAHAENGVY
ncbi:aldehyde dehydrogenase [Simkania negevensis]|uniref:Aldehyde dehydrogenase n=1 Tax=Simkania negevensis TaxID=83561 RepID=A0ABS3AQC6_9BACT|nr:aldehyde dehydrogenase [Simkania negevensis]